MKLLLFLCLLAGCGTCSLAQEVRALYTAEGQFNFRHRFNLVNLCRLEGDFPLGRHVKAEVATLHIVRLNAERIAEDWQTFSNIEEDNMPCGIAVAGLSYATSHCRWFAGVRNVNEDYFTAPGTSLFTNSSNGIFPTLSASLPLANYPLSAMALHFTCEGRSAGIQASLYNGRGRNGWKKKENPFMVSPKDDGVCGMAEVVLRETDVGRYQAGAGMHHGHLAPEYGVGAPHRRDTRGGWWIYAERQVLEAGRGTANLLLSYSEAFGRGRVCRRFAEVGCVANLRDRGNSRIGVSLQQADFAYGRERSGEITCRRTMNGVLDLQPSFQLIRNSNGCYTVLTVRAYLSFNLCKTGGKAL